MRSTVSRIAALVFVLVIAFVAFGCEADTQKKISKANHSIANAIDKTETFTWELHQRGTVGKDEYLAINSILTDINALGRDFHALARTPEELKQ